MIPFHFIEVTCDDGSIARIRADEITVVLERPAKSGRSCVTIPTKAKTIITVHTMSEFWERFNDGNGGLQVMNHKVDAPPLDFSREPPTTPAIRAKRTA